MFATDGSNGQTYAPPANNVNVENPNKYPDASTPDVTAPEERLIEFQSLLMYFFSIKGLIA